MQKLNKLRQIILREIDQNELLQKNLIIQILSSRRLLADHCEILEDAVSSLSSLQYKQTNTISLLNTSSIFAMSGLAFSFLNHNARYLLPMLGGTMISLYVKKYITNNKRIFLEGQLKDLIKALDEFEFVFKKIQTFFSDATMLEQHAKILERYNKDDQVSIHMIFTIKRVIRALYCFIKYLEYFYKIDNEMKYLCPEVDDVDNCAIMVELNHDYKDAKTYKVNF
ncbi:hypothetical protein PVAND_001580 [Polypedilum vanderplanki]|uniref:Uncharacterized protein n=1 Tax=Polypedilum vanderplanki TaxID=319348 RepID=A0A9J6BPN9_POLVA|nr:hypothetical protein PVAND_001580 [Polypedilum vanderplanki]